MIEKVGVNSKIWETPQGPIVYVRACLLVLSSSLPPKFSVDREKLRNDTPEDKNAIPWCALSYGYIELSWHIKEAYKVKMRSWMCKCEFFFSTESALPCQGIKAIHICSLPLHLSHALIKTCFHPKMDQVEYSICADIIVSPEYADSLGEKKKKKYTLKSKTHSHTVG